MNYFMKTKLRKGIKLFATAAKMSWFSMCYFHMFLYFAGIGERFTALILITFVRRFTSMKL